MKSDLPIWRILEKNNDAEASINFFLCIVSVYSKSMMAFPDLGLFLRLCSQTIHILQEDLYTHPPSLCMWDVCFKHYFGGVFVLQSQAFH